MAIQLLSESSRGPAGLTGYVHVPCEVAKLLLLNSSTARSSTVLSMAAGLQQRMQGSNLSNVKQLADNAVGQVPHCVTNRDSRSCL